MNNKQWWKIKKVTTTNASVCKPYGKKKTYVLLKGKGKGSATIQVKVTRTVLKNGKKTTKSKQLSCNVRVKAAAAKAPDTKQTQKEDVTASSQEQLEAALKNTATKTLRFQTEAEDTFTIPKADYSGIDLIVDAPNADMENNGTFQSISVQAINDSTWLENAAGNFLNIFAKTARIVVSQGANVNGIAFAQTGAKVALEVKGSVKEVSFQSPDTDAKVSVSQGSSLENVSVETAAQRTKVDADVSGSVGDVKLAAPQSDLNMAVADGGVVSKVSLDATAENAKVNMDVKGTVSAVSLDAPKADIKMAVDENGKVNGVTVSKEMAITLSGSTKTAIALKISASATITTSTNVTLDSSAGLNLVLLKGSEGSSMKVSGNIAAVSLKIQNKTESNMTVHTSAGNVTIAKNSSRDITVSAPSASGGSTSGGSSSGGSVSSGLITGRIADCTYIYKDGEAEPQGIKITARYAGTGVIYTSADVIGNEKDSPIILPKQSKVTIIRITEDGAEDAPVSKIKLTTESTSIEKGDSVRASVQLNAPEGAKLTNVQFLETANVGGVLLRNGYSLEETVASCSIKDEAKGNDELVAFAIVELPDGTKEEIVSNVVPLEVTDSAPDPSPEETEIRLRTSVSSLQVDQRCLIKAQMDVHANSARILKVKWTSSDPQVIRVNKEEMDGAYGTLIGEAIGKATINACFKQRYLL